MANLFTDVNVKKWKRSKFNLSSWNMLTCKAGQIVPIRTIEIHPGDTHKLRSSIMCRLMPMLAPIMQPIDIYTYTIFCPTRLIHDKWEEFLSGDVDGDYEESLPYVTCKDIHDIIDSNDGKSYWTSKFVVGSLADYIGIPTPDKAGEDYTFWATVQTPVMILPFIAYLQIYFDYFINENLQDFKGYRDLLKYVKTWTGHIDWTADSPWAAAGGMSVDGIDILTNADVLFFLFTLRFKNWKKDYFTSALPFAQRGTPVSISLADSAPVNVTNETSQYNVETLNDVSLLGGESIGDAMKMTAHNDVSDKDYEVNLEADLSEASAVTINELRTLFTLQRYKELLARGGARLKEVLLSLFGEHVADYRLQRPEYLGGGRQPISVSEVLQLSSATDASAQGNMAGHGISIGSMHGFKKTRFTEHGYVFELCVITPQAVYANGLPKMFSRINRLDWPVPVFGHLGEQPIKNKEIFLGSSTDYNEGDFGYQSQYADLKFSLNEVHGQFATTLNYWHMARLFSSQVYLNKNFISTANITNRVFAVTDDTQNTDDHYLLLVESYQPAKRKYPKYGIPRL